MLIFPKGLTVKGLVKLLEEHCKPSDVVEVSCIINDKERAFKITGMFPPEPAATHKYNKRVGLDIGRLKLKISVTGEPHA